MRDAHRTTPRALWLKWVRDYCPIVSPDGRYFYFSSYRGFADSLPLAPQSARSLSDQLHGIPDGLGNVYRVDIAALRRSRQPT